MILWLIGMMGSGKSSAGRLAASRIGVPFADTDEVIMERENRSIREIWEDSGEAAFRAKEAQVVKELAAGEGICSTGGGVVLDEGNRRVMRDSGRVVWLEASVETLARRLATAQDRPALISTDANAGSVLKDMVESRGAHYRRSADIRLETDELSIEETAREIEALWRV